MPRLFLAAAPDDATRAALCALRDRLRAALPDTPRLRWLPDADLHLTLRFFGDVDASRQPPIEALATQAAQRHAPTATMLHRLEHWPPAAPRVVVAAFADEPALAALAANLEAGARAAHFAPETRRFRPHVTLARAPGRPLAPAAIRLPAIVFGITAISLYRSRSGPDAARYEAIGQWPLSPGEPSDRTGTSAR